MLSQNKNTFNSQFCKVKRRFKIQQCENYSPAKCGDKLAGSFVDFCAKCDKII